MIFTLFCLKVEVRRQMGVRTILKMPFTVAKGLAMCGDALKA